VETSDTPILLGAAFSVKTYFHPSRFDNSCLLVVAPDFLNENKPTSTGSTPPFYRNG